VGRAQYEGRRDFIHYGQRPVFFGKLKPVEILGCKTKGIGRENATISQLT
jgi:hypothetical protein